MAIHRRDTSFTAGDVVRIFEYHLSVDEQLDVIEYFGIEIDLAVSESIGLFEERATFAETAFEVIIDEIILRVGGKVGLAIRDAVKRITNLKPLLDKRRFLRYSMGLEGVSPVRQLIKLRRQGLA